MGLEKHSANCMLSRPSTYPKIASIYKIFFEMNSSHFQPLLACQVTVYFHYTHLAIVVLFVYITFICLPTMLCAIPCIHIFCHKKHHDVIAEEF